MSCVDRHSGTCPLLWDITKDAIDGFKKTELTSVIDGCPSHRISFDIYAGKCKGKVIMGVT